MMCLKQNVFLKRQDSQQQILKKLLIWLIIFFISCFTKQEHFWGEHFLKWIQILMVTQQQNSLVLIEVCLKITNLLNNIKGSDIQGHIFSYTAYTDDSSFFFNNKKSFIEPFKILDKFSFFLGLKPNKEKSEVVGIGVKYGENVAPCGMKNINLKKT